MSRTNPNPTPEPLPAEAAKVNPKQITTNTTAEYMAVVARHSRGEIKVNAIHRGKTNGQWIFKIN